jgi:hypothetical protein
MGEWIGPGGGSGTGSTGGGGIASGIASPSTASVASPANPTSGVAFTPSTTFDSTVVFQFTLSGTVVVTIGPSTGAENNLVNGAAVVANGSEQFPCPATWKMIITLTTATLAQTRVVLQ